MLAMIVSVNQRFSQIEEVLQAQARTSSELMLEGIRTKPKTTNTTSPYIEINRTSETSRNSKL